MKNIRILILALSVSGMMSCNKYTNVSDGIVTQATLFNQSSMVITLRISLTIEAHL